VVERTLITTADERTWPKEKSEPVLFLGEWCTLYDRKKYWSDLNYKIVPYHWHDKNKFNCDYYYLQDLYEELLKQLVAQLNKEHSVDHSLKYWRILVGPWLGYFIQMLFDRWFMLDYTLNNYEIKSCTIFKRDDYAMIPSDMQEFSPMYMKDDWNEMIYGQLLSRYYANRINIKTVIKSSEQENLVISSNIKSVIRRQIRNIIISLLNLFNKITCKDDDYFFLSSCIPIKTLIKLQLSLKQLPKYWRPQQLPRFFVDSSKRNQFYLTNTQSDKTEKYEFKEVAQEMISNHIPTAYQEGYKNLIKIVNQSPWPRTPKSIFTSNAYISDDYFKAWSASKVEENIPLLIGQHGGMFGMTPFAYAEEHQIETSDAWISWGWQDSENKKIKPVGNFKQYQIDLEYNPQGGGLLVTFVTPRYNYHMFSTIVPSQWPEYFDEQCRFIEGLPKPLQKEMTVRLYKDDRSWGQKSRWQDRFPDVKLDHADQRIEEMIKRSRIFIATYNSTTYLETFALNIPTIAFWNPDHWDLRNDVKDDFQSLKNAKILHDTPESAAKHLADIWDDIPRWWNSKEIQQVKDKFCKRWSYTGDDLFDKLVTVIKDASN